MTPPSVVEVIGAGRIMSDLLGPRKIKNGLTNCINPSHPDKHPSMSIDLDGGVFNCHSCGVHGGALDFAVLSGIGRDKADAAAQLALKYHVNGNGHSKPAIATNPQPWPYYPKTAIALGWEIGDGQMLVPTFLPDGTRGRTKIRGQRNEAGKLQITFENDAAEIGLINLPALIDHSAGAESPSCALVAGETDLLAWTWACKDAGLDIPAVSMATGEETTLSGDRLLPFRGVKVYVVYDNDDVGRKGAEKNAAALRAGGADPVILTIPAPYKDVRDYVQAGEKLIALIQQKPKEPEPVAAVTSWDFAETVSGPDPAEPEMFVARLLIRDSLNLVFGPPASGKSWFMMGLGYDAVTTGGAFLGSDDLAICAPSDGREERCLWVFGSEDTPNRVLRRLKKLHGGGNPDHPVKPKGFVYSTPADGVLLNTPEGWAWLAAQIEEHQPTILVLDTIASLNANALDVNKAEVVVPFMQKLLMLRTKYRLTIIGGHHTSKPSKDAGRSTISKAASMLGSQAFLAMTESCIMVEAKDGDTSDVKIRCVKTKDISDPIPALRACLDRDTGRFRLMDDDEDADERDAVSRRGRPPRDYAAELAVICVQDGSVDLRKAHKILGISEKTWANNRAPTIDTLNRAGHVVIDGVLKRCS